MRARRDALQIVDVQEFKALILQDAARQHYDKKFLPLRDAFETRHNLLLLGHDAEVGPRPPGKFN